MGYHNIFNTRKGGAVYNTVQYSTIQFIIFSQMGFSELIYNTNIDLKKLICHFKPYIQFF